MRHPSKFFFRISHQEELFTLNAISIYARKHHHLLQTIRAQKQIKVEHFQFHGDNTMHAHLSIDFSNQFLFAAKKFCQPTWKRARLIENRKQEGKPTRERQKDSDALYDHFSETLVQNIAYIPSSIFVSGCISNHKISVKTSTHIPMPCLL